MVNISLSLLQILILTIICVPHVSSYTVVVSESGVPSALVDAPQTGFSMNKNNIHTDPHEQRAVYDIMKATGNDWAIDIPDVCRGRWHGIECMPDKNQVYHVVSLSFGALSDDTAFPTCDQKRSFLSHSLTKLPHIKTLFFYRCFSYNPQRVPSFLGQLGTTLQTLVLRDNGLVGPIPTELGNLTRLKVLDLHKNNLNGSIPVSLGWLKNLKSLDLSCNKLSGLIPGLKYPVLNVLDLNQNYLTGSIPKSLGNCPLLVKMDLSRNRFSGSIPESIKGLKSLILLDLSYNQLSGPFPTTIGSLNTLQSLILKGNRMESTIIPSIDGFKGLMILVMSDMALHGPIPNWLGKLPNLRVLHLDRNRLNGTIPKTFQDLKEMSELRLNDNQLMGPIPLKREVVWKMGRKLKLFNNSGLCYDTNYVHEEDFGSSVNTGIGYCGAPDPNSITTTQHLSLADKHFSISIGNSSASAIDLSIRLSSLVLLISLVFFQ